MKFILYFAFLLLVFESGNTAKILGVFPFPGRSHMNVYQALMEELARRGHEVTVLSPFPLKKPIKNYRYIEIPNAYAEMMQAMGGSSERKEILSFHGTSSIQMFKNLDKMMIAVSEKVLPQPNVQELIHSKEEKFDLLIISGFFLESFMTFAHKFNTPIVLFSPNIVFSWMADVVGNPRPPSCVPEIFTTNSDQMNFFERIVNTYVGLVSTTMMNFVLYPHQQEIINKYFNYTNTPPTLEDLNKRVSLVLTNSHFSLNKPKPLLPNVVEVAGMHVKEPKPLPKDIQSIMDSSTQGVLFFSMGSNVRSADLPKEMSQAIHKSFSKMKHQILWKWEEDKIPRLSSNIELRTWFPQSDMLAHKNMAAFITHGGLLSTTEALTYGVPVIGIPVFADQVTNMKQAVGMGYGILLDLANVTEESFSWALNEIVNNPKYKMNAQKLSKVFTDRSTKPMDLAVYWVEYVIRHKGAQHLQSAAILLNWYQYLLLDVIGFFLLCATVIIMTTYMTIKFLISQFTKSSTKKSNAAMHKKRK